MVRERAHLGALGSSDAPVYGISTGFGALATRHIPPEKRTKLQKSLIRSHAAGIGASVDREVIRALMFLRAKTLVSGHTGICVEVLATMLDVLNAGITPVVYEYGSLVRRGPAGDRPGPPPGALQPLRAHSGHALSADTM